jgi:hypothetical protein
MLRIKEQETHVTLLVHDDDDDDDKLLPCIFFKTRSCLKIGADPHIKRL